MPTLTNQPRQQTLLRLAARKSFAYGLVITDANGTALDITDTVIRFVSKRPPFDTADLADDDNLIVNSTATLVTPTAGYAVFNFQASDLDHAADIYPFIIVMDYQGYTSPLAEGQLELIDNPDFDSADNVYVPTDAPATILQVWLQNRHVIKVSTGNIMAPNSTTFTDADKTKLDSLAQADWNIDETTQPGAILNRPLDQLVPDPAAPNQFLKSSGNLPGQFGWAVGVFDGGAYGDIEDPGDPGFFIPPVGAFTVLDPTGAANGASPTADGAGNWGWEVGATVSDLDDVPDSATRLAMTTAERSKLAGLSETGADWDAGIGEPGYIDNKPTLGTAAAEDVGAFMPAGPIDATEVTTGVFDPARIPTIGTFPSWKHGTITPTTADIGPNEVYLKHT